MVAIQANAGMKVVGTGRNGLWWGDSRAADEHGFGLDTMSFTPRWTGRFPKPIIGPAGSRRHGAIDREVEQTPARAIGNRVDAGRRPHRAVDENGKK